MADRTAAGKDNPVKENDDVNRGRQIPGHGAAASIHGKHDDVRPAPEHGAAGNAPEHGAAGEGQHEERTANSKATNDSPGRQTPGHGAAALIQGQHDEDNEKTDMMKELLNKNSPGTEEPDKEHQIEDLATNKTDYEDENVEAPDAGLAQHTQAMSREGGHALLSPL